MNKEYILNTNTRFSFERPLAYRKSKRVFDVIGSGILLIVLSPLFLLLAVLIRRDGGKSIYSQVRIGHSGERFMCYKFRSMVTNSQEMLDELLETDPEIKREWEQHCKLRNDPRITPIGRILRKTSLDELPQLFNVLCGEMSLVGPRPIVQDEMSRYGKKLNIYYSARPGMTGLWQVSGRNDVSYNQRIVLDCEYVRGWGMWQDILLLFRTVGVVMNPRGAY